jgi:hypothetical protein
LVVIIYNLSYTCHGVLFLCSLDVFREARVAKSLLPMAAVHQRS